MSRRRQTANISNPTHSNRQDPQHMAAADIRYEMRLFAHPNRSHLNWHDPRNLSLQDRRMSTVATPQFSATCFSDIDGSSKA